MRTENVFHNLRQPLAQQAYYVEELENLVNELSLKAGTTGRPTGHKTRKAVPVLVGNTGHRPNKTNISFYQQAMLVPMSRKTSGSGLSKLGAASRSPKGSKPGMKNVDLEQVIGQPDPQEKRARPRVTSPPSRNDRTPSVTQTPRTNTAKTTLFKIPLNMSPKQHNQII